MSSQVDIRQEMFELDGDWGYGMYKFVKPNIQRTSLPEIKDLFSFANELDQDSDIQRIVDYFNIHTGGCYFPSWMHSSGKLVSKGIPEYQG